MRKRLTSPRAMQVLAWASVLLTVPPLASAMIASALSQSWVELGTLAFLLLADVIVVWLIFQRHKPKKPRETEVFTPFARLVPEAAWPRPSDVDRVLDAIHADGPALPLIVGTSGVGKSTLLDVLVRREIAIRRTRISYRTFEQDYSTLDGWLEKAVSDRRPGDHLVLVLDQFEQWLAYVSTRPHEERVEMQRSLAATLRRIHAMPGCTPVISLRREWYFELAFLGELIPKPADACEIQAPKVDDGGDKMRAAMFESFLTVLKDPEIAEQILNRLGAGGRLSPLKAQIVGAVIERERKEAGKIDLEYFDLVLGGVDGAIEAYFQEEIDGSRRPDICMKALCALSVKTRFRGETELGDIVGSLYEDQDTVLEAMKYLWTQGLVLRLSSGTFALAHDYLAEFFYAKSGAELHPVERDNISAYVAGGGQNSVAVMTGRQRERHKRRPLGMIVVVGLLLLMGLRFLFFDFDTTLLGPEISQPLTGPLFDSTYILIFVPYAAWIVYIGLFYDRLLVHLNESGIERIFSIFVVLNLIISILIGIFIPFAWLLGIASGGIVFTAKILWLSRNPQISPSARHRLRSFGIVTMCNLILAAILGAADIILSFRYVSVGNNIETWVVINLIVSAMVTYWCIALAPSHVTRSGIAQLLGLIGRPHSVANAYSEA